MSLVIAEKLLREGELVALPTDTVYGIGALALDENAVEKLYSIKNRPLDKAVTVNLSDPSELCDYLESENPVAIHFAKKFWPGALTIVARVKKELIHPKVRAGSDFCGFRVADHDQLRGIIKNVGPIALPSANLSGEPPLLTPEEVQKQFPDLYVVVSEIAPQNVPSTVIQIDEDVVTILREGAIDQSEIDQHLKSFKESFSIL